MFEELSSLLAEAIQHDQLRCDEEQIEVTFSSHSSYTTHRSASGVTTRSMVKAMMKEPACISESALLQCSLECDKGIKRKQNCIVCIYIDNDKNPPHMKAVVRAGMLCGKLCSDSFLLSLLCAGTFSS